MTVTWSVEAVEEWCKKHKEKDFVNSYEEANKRFGKWMHSASYSSCFELRERVEEYLEAKGINSSKIFDVISFFCGVLKAKVEYDEYVYKLLKEALNNIAKESKEEIIKLHAISLIELIKTAENLKSNIICSG